ncbi:hypothetical protein [Kitasatospora sp. NPDC057500]|uniref:hypothetical protein n=1 Tax=Kitasatospora sp. NPDC057500 TaxID=3346151 RepID=UPI0036C42360
MPEARTSDPSPRLGPLSALVSDALTRMSFRELAEAAVDPESGYVPGLSYLNKLSKGKITRAPEPQVLRALATGIRLPLRQVQAAAAEEFLEYIPTELADLPPDVRAIVGHLADMDPTDLPRTRAVIEALIAAEDEKSRSRNV